MYCTWLICSQAEEAIQEALKNATDNPHTHFLAFKLALVQEDTDKGTVVEWTIQTFVCVTIRDLLSKKTNGFCFLL